jgi:hypothetical protein
MLPIPCPSWPLAIEKALHLSGPDNAWRRVRTADKEPLEEFDILCRDSTVAARTEQLGASRDKTYEYNTGLLVHSDLHPSFHVVKKMGVGFSRACMRCHGAWSPSYLAPA